MKKREFEANWKEFMKWNKDYYRDNKSEIGCSYSEYMEDYEKAKEIVEAFVIDFLGGQN